MKKQLEKPFENLRRKDNTPFDPDIVKNWYKARAFVLDKLKDVAFLPSDNSHLHVVVDVDKDDKQLSPLMMAVVRQIALSAHYLNFFEGNEQEPPRNRTFITLVSKHNNLREELDKEEYLCNLLKFCQYKEGDSKPDNEDSYVDLEFHVVEVWNNGEDFRFSEQNVIDFCNNKPDDEIFSIDTRMADFASRMYELGADFDNLPAEDIHCTQRYSAALDVFRYKKLVSSSQKIFDDKMNQASLSNVKERISNILCADCFRIREKSIEECKKNGAYRSSKRELWAAFNEPLSKSEHARWVVEKLILGYRPMNAEERYHYESLQFEGNGKQKQKDYCKSLKRSDKDPSHIDLCSYRDLRRINPDDLKYDSFLMLAIPIILHKVNKKSLLEKLFAFLYEN